MKQIYIQGAREELSPEESKTKEVDTYFCESKWVTTNSDHVCSHLSFLSCHQQLLRLQHLIPDGLHCSLFSSLMRNLNHPVPTTRNIVKGSNLGFVEVEKN